MKQFIGSLSIIVAIIVIVTVQPTFALDLGTNITISDGNYEGTGWYSDREDEETEPGTATDQTWDLEGMFLDGNILSLVGGYDFMNGNGVRFGGDIFIDVDGNMVYGEDVIDVIEGGEDVDGYYEVGNNFGYDYVIDITDEIITAESGVDYDQTTLKTRYEVYAIDNSDTLLSPYWRNFDEAGAYRYIGGGDLVGSGKLLYETDFSYDDTGFLGDNHNVLSVSLDFLDPETMFTAHYTMGCGNDDLIGEGTTSPVPTPEPGTLLLFGGGLLGLIVMIRKRMM